MKTILFTMLMGLIVGGCQTAPTATADSPVVVTKAGVSDISPAEARPAVEAAYSQFIDVRTADEYTAGHAYRARNIPLDTLLANLDKLEKNEPVYLICATDNRSRQAAQILVDAGFPQAIVVKGGTAAWKASSLPMANEAPVNAEDGIDERTRAALTAALEDERRAIATYQAILNKFADARPFVNIIEAEKRHESFLLPLFEKYGVAVPLNEFDPAKIAIPESITNACKAGVTAEKENIALYDGFLQFVKEPDIKEIFVRLQSASRDNHLPAFTRCSEGGLGKRRGRARPF